MCLDVNVIQWYRITIAIYLAWMRTMATHSPDMYRVNIFRTWSESRECFWSRLEVLVSFVFCVTLCHLRYHLFVLRALFLYKLWLNKGVPYHAREWTQHENDLSDHCPFERRHVTYGFRGGCTLPLFHTVGRKTLLTIKMSFLVILGIRPSHLPQTSIP